MNIQHSSRSDEWFTPSAIMHLVRQVLGDIELDPSSCARANQNVRAARFLTKEQDGLTSDWGTPSSVFLNPPGGRLGRKSLSGLFWQRLVAEVESGRVGHAVYMGFSLEQLATTQNYGPKSIGEYLCCFPRTRIRFDYVGVPGEKSQPSHSNVVAYLPGRVDVSEKFRSVFSTLGVVR